MLDVTSLQEDLSHQPVLDVIVPVTLRPGADGHTSVHLETSLRWGQYLMLLAALAAAGIIEQDYVKASMAQGFSAIPAA